MERTREPLNIVINSDKDFTFSGEENETLHELLAVLSAKQIRAARLEASGFDVATIASTVKAAYQTIISWRRDKNYANAKNLFISIINKQGLQFRLDCQRQIVAPMYAELIRRTSDPRIRKNFALKDVLNVLRTINSETRADSKIGSISEDSEELEELQKRRDNFSIAKQAQEVEALKRDDKIIQFPDAKIANGGS